MSDPIDFSFELMPAIPGGVDVVTIKIKDGPRGLALIEMSLADFGLALLAGATVTASIERPGR